MKRMLLFGLGLLLAGCASSHVDKKPIEPVTGLSQVKYSIKNIEDKSEKIVPEHFLESIKGYLKAEMKKRNMLAEEELETNRDVVIQVTYYRMRSGFTRMMFGVMAGKDGVASTVTVLDAKTGEEIGASEVNTYNVLAVGGEQDVARMHAEEIANFLDGKKK